MEWIGLGCLGEQTEGSRRYRLGLQMLREPLGGGLRRALELVGVSGQVATGVSRRREACPERSRGSVSRN